MEVGGWLLEDTGFLVCSATSTSM